MVIQRITVSECLQIQNFYMTSFLWCYLPNSQTLCDSARILQICYQILGSHKKGRIGVLQIPMNRGAETAFRGISTHTESDVMLYNMTT